MVGRAGLLLLCLGVTGCGLGVQAAVLSTPAKAPPSLAALPVVGPAEGAEQLAIRPEGSLLEVSARDIAVGDHTLSFSSFRGTLSVEPGGKGALSLTVDMREVTTELSVVTSIIKHELLEADLYPHTRLDARFVPAGEGGDGGERVFEGTMALHGTTRGIRFKGTVAREKEGYRLKALFDMSRKAFGIKRGEKYDWMIYDDFRVEFDLVARPQKVTVEVGPPAPSGDRSRTPR